MGAGAGGGNFYRCKLDDGHPGSHIPESHSANIVQCNHADMSCPPGECQGLYPPHREDMGR